MSTTQKKLWQLQEPNQKIVKLLQNELAISEILARILVNRHIHTVEAAQRFLTVNLSQLHDPFSMQDMQKFCERIAQAITKGQKICIYGDYDVDGSVATALLVLFFRDIGIDVMFYIPCRQKEGYSLNVNALQKLKEQKVDLVITVDNGTMAHEAVTFAKTLGIDVIITDHHKVGETLPDAYAVINPQRKDCTYPFKGLCGAGVAFKLVTALRHHLRSVGYFANRAEPHLKQYFDLICISTICDVVPLIDENRLFVQEGLKHLQHTKRLGLKALMAVCEMTDAVNATDVGFKMGPRLNAAGRLDDASHGVRLLISEDALEAKGLASDLNRLNLERRAIELTIVQEAFDLVLQQEILPHGLVVFAKDWHVGVVGIVASRLVEKFHRPAFVLCQTESGELKGSGRSFGDINLMQALQPCAGLFEKFGGHEAAAGVSLKSENLNAFRETFAKAVQVQWPDDVQPQKLWRVDAELSLVDLSEDLFADIEKLEPFGMGNAAPLFLAKQLQVVSKRIVGEKHLKLKFKMGSQSFDAIAFQKAERFATLPDVLDVLFHLERNRYQGRETLQLMIREIL